MFTLNWERLVRNDRVAEKIERLDENTSGAISLLTGLGAIWLSLIVFSHFMEWLRAWTG